MKNLAVVLMVLTLPGCGSGMQEMTLTGICDGYPDYATSPYVIPFTVGTSHKVGQGNCGAASHMGNEKYAYDIAMPIGTTVLAARAGTVKKVIQDKSDGNGCIAGENHIFILHPDGTYAKYLHLTHNGSLVNEGDTVTQGQIIGQSGNTGCSSGPHLHFQVDADDSSNVSTPVTFSNVGPNRRGLIIDKTYTAQ